MKLTMFDVVFRPIKTSRRLMALMKAIELEPKFKPNERLTLKETGYTVLTSNVMMPTAVFNMINASLVKVNTESYSPLTWKREKEQDLTVYPVSYENAVVMLVQERLEQ